MQEKLFCALKIAIGYPPWVAFVFYSQKSAQRQSYRDLIYNINDRARNAETQKIFRVAYTVTKETLQTHTAQRFQQSPDQNFDGE
jgi:hypothetical protein